MTFAELKAALDASAAEQLAKPVYWCGDDRGGSIESFGFTDEDTIYDDDSGELYLRSEYEAEHGDPAKCAWPAHKVVAKGGEPILYTDGVADPQPLR